jgi:uncharacterized repeat protein (TIGR01451 family)
MGFPSDNTAGDAAKKTAESSVGGPGAMTMRLPNFDEVPSMDTQTTSAASESGDRGPSIKMGLPIAEVPSTTAPSAPSLSGVQFAETPGTSFDQRPDDAGVTPGVPPTNDLRGGPMPDLNPPPSVLGDEASGLQTDDAGTASIELMPPAAQGPGFNGPGFADSVDPSSGVPAAMLNPLLPTDQADAQPELMAGPGTTMRIHREPPVQLEIGGEALTAQALTAGDLSAQSYPQPPGNPKGFAGPPQAPGGDGTPYNDPSPGQTGAGQAASLGALPAAAASAFEAPAIPSQLGYNPLPGQSAPAARGASPYQAVGFKQQGGSDRPLPAGPTLAEPGERFLDGPQAPSLVIHKRAPAEVKVGKPASFVITVKNVGGSKALDVHVHDRVPAGMTLTDATPRPNPQYQPELFWELGDLEPNQERTITLQLTPEQEGELGSVARVTFQAAASVRTISTRPELKIVQKAPEKVLIGQQLEIELEVSNPGSGEATGVILQEDVPEGLEHPQGKKLDNLLGTLGPGDIRRQILRMRAVKPGVVQNQIRVKGDDGLESTHTVAVEVIAPDLQVGLTGPSRRYLERQATYSLDIANIGTADATNVELSVQLDRGFTFVKTDFEGQYDPTRHAVFWSLPALPIGQSGKVPLTLLPVEEGKLILRTDASADLGVKSSVESEVDVDSLAELSFAINDSADPIEVGGQTTYEVRISNSGSRDDTNVRVALQLPPGMQLVEQGDFTEQGQGIIAFSPRALLKANDEMVYHVKARGVTPGRHLVKAIVTSDQSDVPVTKEESIKVYSDR